MQRGRRIGGYTIIEIMIFLAVSGFIFLIAATFIQGKQTTAQFNQAMNSINTRIQQLISGVGDNNYLPTGLQCNSSGGSLSFPPSGGSQGGNYGCVFLGKVVQFAVGNTNYQGYDIYTIAGCQYANCSPNSSDPLETLSPSSFAEAEARTVDPGSNNTCAASLSSANLTTCNQLQWGLQASAMYDDSSGTPVATNSLGLFNSFIESNGQGLVSGTQYVDAVDTGFNNISFASNITESEMVGTINNNISTVAQAIVNPYFVICFKDGAGHAGALTIGGSNASGSLSTSVQTSDSPIEIFNNPNYKCAT